MVRIVRKGWLLGLVALVSLVGGLILTHPAQAHGGVMIETGVTDHFEWLVSINPYPTNPGPAVVSLLIFDMNTNKPAMNFSGAVYLAPPNSEVACCEPGVHAGPFQLFVDPIMYPGDYSAYLPIDATGDWQVQFVMEREGEALEVVATIPVQATPGAGPVDPLAIATQVAMLNAAALAQEMTMLQAQSPLANGMSPLAQPDSPLPIGLGMPVALTVVEPTPGQAPLAEAVGGTSAPSRSWLIWGGMGLIVVIGVVASLLRAKTEE